MCDPNQSSDSLGYVYTLDPEEHLIRDACLEKRLIHIWRSLDSPLKVSMRLAQKLWPGSSHDQCTFRSATVQGTLQSKVWAASHSIPSWTFFRFSRKSYMANTLSALEPIRMVHVVLTWWTECKDLSRIKTARRIHNSQEGLINQGSSCPRMISCGVPPCSPLLLLAA